MTKKTPLLLLVILSFLLALPSVAANAQGEQFVRFQTDGAPTFTCEQGQGTIVISISNVFLEFNVPPDALVTGITYFNGVEVSSMTSPPPQTSGIIPLLPGAFFPVPSYPVDLELRLITLVGGSPIYQSSFRVACAGDILTPQPITIININLKLSPVCLIPLPADAVQGRLLSTVTALFSPNAIDTTNVVLPAGSAWFVIDAQDGYYKLWVACQAQTLWVPADAIGPNYEPPWHGAPLPVPAETEPSET